jgi:hypothetical protein
VTRRLGGPDFGRFVPVWVCWYSLWCQLIDFVIPSYLTSCLQLISHNFSVNVANFVPNFVVKFKFKVHTETHK